MCFPARLVELMQDVECKINLIMFNPHKGTRFTASSMDQVEAFRAIIMQVRYPELKSFVLFWSKIVTQENDGF